MRTCNIWYYVGLIVIFYSAKCVTMSSIISLEDKIFSNRAILHSSEEHKPKIYGTNFGSYGSKISDIHHDNDLYPKIIKVKKIKSKSNDDKIKDSQTFKGRKKKIWFDPKYMHNHRWEQDQDKSEKYSNDKYYQDYSNSKDSVDYNYDYIYDSDTNDIYDYNDYNDYYSNELYISPQRKYSSSPPNRFNRRLINSNPQPPIPASYLGPYGSLSLLVAAASMGFFLLAMEKNYDSFLGFKDKISNDVSKFLNVENDFGKAISDFEANHSITTRDTADENSKSLHRTKRQFDPFSQIAISAAMILTTYIAYTALKPTIITTEPPVIKELDESKSTFEPYVNEHFTSIFDTKTSAKPNEFPLIDLSRRAVLIDDQPEKDNDYGTNFSAIYKQVREKPKTTPPTYHSKQNVKVLPRPISVENLTNGLVSDFPYARNFSSIHQPTKDKPKVTSMPISKLTKLLQEYTAIADSIIEKNQKTPTKAENKISISYSDNNKFPPVDLLSATPFKVQNNRNKNVSVVSNIKHVDDNLYKLFYENNIGHLYSTKVPSTAYTTTKPPVLPTVQKTSHNHRVISKSPEITKQIIKETTPPSIIKEQGNKNIYLIRQNYKTPIQFEEPYNAYVNQRSPDRVKNVNSYAVSNPHETINQKFIYTKQNFNNKEETNPYQNYTTEQLLEKLLQATNIDDSKKVPSLMFDDNRTSRPIMSNQPSFRIVKNKLINTAVPSATLDFMESNDNTDFFYKSNKDTNLHKNRGLVVYKPDENKNIPRNPPTVYVSPKRTTHRATKFPEHTHPLGSHNRNHKKIGKLRYLDTFSDIPKLSPSPNMLLHTTENPPVEYPVEVTATESPWQKLNGFLRNVSSNEMTNALSLMKNIYEKIF